MWIIHPNTCEQSWHFASVRLGKTTDLSIWYVHHSGFFFFCLFQLEQNNIHSRSLILSRFVESYHVTINTSQCSNLEPWARVFISLNHQIVQETRNRFAFKSQRFYTLPWISYLMGPSNSAPNAINFVTVLLISATVKERSEEYPFCTMWSLRKHEQSNLIRTIDSEISNVIWTDQQILQLAGPPEHERCFQRDWAIELRKLSQCPRKIFFLLWRFDMLTQMIFKKI